MTDPNTADGSADDTPIRTWTRMTTGDRPQGEAPDLDPFSFFTSGDEKDR